MGAKWRIATLGGAAFANRLRLVAKDFVAAEGQGEVPHEFIQIGAQPSSSVFIQRDSTVILLTSGAFFPASWIVVPENAVSPQDLKAPVFPGIYRVQR